MLSSVSMMQPLMQLSVECLYLVEGLIRRLVCLVLLYLAEHRSALGTLGQDLISKYAALLSKRGSYPVCFPVPLSQDKETQKSKANLWGNWTLR